MDDAAFLVDFGGIECQTVSPVAEDEEAGVHIVGRNGHVVDVVDRFIGCRVGIEVLSELHTDCFAILCQVVTGEVVRTVETHVFEEVGETALVFLFLH